MCGKAGVKNYVIDEGRVHPSNPNLPVKVELRLPDNGNSPSAVRGLLRN
jgi:hypothetical protein